MPDGEGFLTVEEQMDNQRAYQARLDKINGAIERMPPAARAVVTRWRSDVERAGRHRPQACPLHALETFVADVQSVYDGAWAVFSQTKVADRTHRGPGL